MRGCAVDLTDILFVEVARTVRKKLFSNFGETTDGKVAARWSVGRQSIKLPRFG